MRTCSHSLSKTAVLFLAAVAGVAWMGYAAETPASNSTSTTTDRFRPAQRRYWAFQPVTAQAPPQLPGTVEQPLRNPIDAFTLSKLTEKGITPSPEADKVTLLRRAYFDLIGIPPTPEETAAFLADQSPQAYERMIDRLLASPHYGERWGRHWLDLARYAESDGFRADDIRPTAWRYRDYVIRAFNEDKPYDRFVQEQIAGDEMFPDDISAHVATAFNRQYPDEYNAQNLRSRRQEILNDITDTVGSVFLGLTFECARCHDHKFDPILQSDYYRLQAFFSQVSADDEFPMMSKTDYAEYKRKLAAWEEKTADIRKQISALVADRMAKSRKSRYTAYVEEVKVALDKPLAERTPMEIWMADKAKYFMNPDEMALAAGLKGDAKKQFEELKAKLDQFKDLYPGPLEKGTGMTELTKEIIPTHVLSVGVYNKPLAKVEPGFLTILHPENAKIEPLPGNTTSSGRRTALAKWLTDPKNPLVPRVMVNRIWHHHFGKGIVGSTSDFGIMGQRRTHPELLEWLAAEFVRSGWSIKRMHKLMMTSQAYKQASAFRADAAEKDPNNNLLWRFERKRLEGEAIRDTALAVSGLLNPELFGPSVRPPVPSGVSAWKTDEAPASHFRRSIYTFVRRNTPYPMLETFDAPDTHLSCGRRGTTITAPQALTYLNSEQTMDWARGFAARVLALAGNDSSAQVETAYRLAFSRSPNGAEKDMALSFLDQHKALVEERATAGEKLAVPDKTPPAMTAAQAATLVDFCHALVNSSEFVYVN